MLHKWKSTIVFFGTVSALFLVAAIVFLRLDNPSRFAVPIWASVFLSLVIPFTIIAIRHQVRRNRIKLIDVFAENFGIGPNASSGQLDNVSFEFVRGKYFVDLDLAPGVAPTISKVPRFPMMLHADWMLLFCAIPYMVFSGFGIFVLFSPLAEIASPDGAVAQWLLPSILAAGGSDAGTTSDPEKLRAFHVNVLTIAALAFAGAYFYTLRLFLRAVAAFDLSPITFLRAFAHMVLAVILAVVLYRVFPSEEAFLSALSGLTGAAGGQETTTTIPAAPNIIDTTDGLNSVWLLIAFTLGFLPEAALQFVLQKAHLTFKQRYTELERHARQIPLTILDGIDHFIEFRLEEANIFDMQNLATANPIMLHIESPYGIYQVVDWIAQAQLCTVVGPDRFLLLKTFNIRTIFDLKRILVSDTADPAVQRAAGRMILEDNSRDQQMRSALGFAAVPTFALDLQQDAGADLPVEALQHLAQVMLDDLHVHRLWQVWTAIFERLSPPPAGNLRTGQFRNGAALQPADIAADAA